MTQFEKTVAYFRESSDEDLKIAQKLFSSKDYAYSLFFCHLALEKMIKGIVVLKTDSPVSQTHFLLLLAEKAGLPLNENQIADLKAITKFNIAGRYDDDKREFRKLATGAYALKYLNITQELLLWLKNYLKK